MRLAFGNMWKRRVGGWAASVLLVVIVGVGIAEGRATRTVIRTGFSHWHARIVVGPARYTVYVFCSGSSLYCRGHPSSVSFRPLVAYGRVVTTPWSQIKASKLGTRRLANQQRQVTYYGEPLYLYEGDRKPGQTNGERARQGSGSWWAIGPNGQPAFVPIY